MNTQPLKKKHHRVSAFYLRHFATLQPEEAVWTYDLEKDTVRPSTSENTGYEKHLYSVTLPDGTRCADVEDWIADIESDAAPVHAKLIGGEALTDEERSRYADFMALMLVRTDAFRQQYAEGLIGMLQVRNLATANHDKAFEHLIENYQRDTGKLLTERDIELLRDGMRHPEKFRVGVKKEVTLLALGLQEKLAPIFCAMNWTILRVKPPRFLITSDNPLIHRVADPDSHPIFRGGLLHKRSEVTLPLSLDTCLLATWNNDLPKRSELDRETVKDLNRLRAIYAVRYLFAPIMDEGIRTLGRKYKDMKPTMKISLFGPKELSPVSLERRGARS